MSAIRTTNIDDHNTVSSSNSSVPSLETLKISTELPRSDREYVSKLETEITKLRQELEEEKSTRVLLENSLRQIISSDIQDDTDSDQEFKEELFAHISESTDNGIQLLGLMIERCTPTIINDISAISIAIIDILNHIQTFREAVLIYFSEIPRLFQENEYILIYSLTVLYYIIQAIRGSINSQFLVEWISRGDIPLIDPTNYSTYANFEHSLSLIFFSIYSILSLKIKNAIETCTVFSDMPNILSTFLQTCISLKLPQPIQKCLSNQSLLMADTKLFNMLMTRPIFILNDITNVINRLESMFKIKPPNLTVVLGLLLTKEKNLEKIRGSFPTLNSKQLVLLLSSRPQDPLQVLIFMNSSEKLLLDDEIVIIVRLDTVHISIPSIEFPVLTLHQIRKLVDSTPDEDTSSTHQIEQEDNGSSSSDTE